MNRGYAGFYKGFYLRSSYEYAYAVYLDTLSIAWSYEDKVFDIGYKRYKPDFFFYDQSGNLEKIVEIKAREPKLKVSALKDLNLIEEIYNIKCYLISYEELLSLYKELPFSLNSIITKWNTSPDTTINKSAKGKLNAHYNMKHSEEVKKKIGKHTKQLWEANSSSKLRMIEGLRNSGLSQKGKIKTPREKRRCRLCATEFQVLITSSQKYCTQQCSGKYAIEIATQAYIHKRISVHAEIRNFIVQWALQNNKIVLQAQYNKINPSLKPMIDEIYQRFGVKDFRVISKAVFGEDRGRKELLVFMKQVCNENVC